MEFFYDSSVLRFSFVLLFQCGGGALITFREEFSVGVCFQWWRCFNYTSVICVFIYLLSDSRFASSKRTEEIV